MSTGTTVNFTTKKQNKTKQNKTKQKNKTKKKKKKKKKKNLVCWKFVDSEVLYLSVFNVCFPPANNLAS